MWGFVCRIYLGSLPRRYRDTPSRGDKSLITSRSRLRGFRE